MKIGQGIIKINWKYNTTNFSTIAIVDNEKGIIYDNLLTNILIIKKENNGIKHQYTTMKNTQLFFNIDDCISMPPYAPFIYPKEAYLGDVVTGDWIWGSQRGRAEATLTVEGYTDETMGYTRQYITCATVDYSCYMNLGSCDAQEVITERNVGLNGDVYADYGLYLATPVAQVTMTYGVPGGFNIQITAGFGSVAKKAGSRAFYANDWNLYP